jgi:Flp pilus assembly protein TadG
MLTTRLRSRRRGSILPLMVISLVALCGCVALAVDVGLILAARTQCQNAADAAALAGTRALDGAPDSNPTAAFRLPRAPGPRPAPPRGLRAPL